MKEYSVWMITSRIGMDEWSGVAGVRDEALETAKAEWNHLTAGEKKRCSVEVWAIEAEYWDAVECYPTGYDLIWKNGEYMQ